MRTTNNELNGMNLMLNWESSVYKQVQLLNVAAAVQVDASNSYRCEGFVTPDILKVGVHESCSFIKLQCLSQCP